MQETLSLFLKRTTPCVEVEFGCLYFEVLSTHPFTWCRRQVGEHRVKSTGSVNVSVVNPLDPGKPEVHRDWFAGGDLGPCSVQKVCGFV